MKNAWDLLASVRQRLADGEQLVEFALWVTPESGQGIYNRAEDENQVVYDLSGELFAMLDACVELRISHATVNTGRRQSLSFGPGIKPFDPQSSADPNTEWVDLMTTEGWDRLRELLPPPNPDDPNASPRNPDDEDNDDWWRR